MIEAEFKEAKQLFDEGQYEKANSAFIRLAERNKHPNSAFYAGMMIDKGMGWEPYLPTAIYFYTIAAAQGHVEAQVNLAKLWEDEHLHSEAIRWYRKAAKSGNAHAQYNLARYILRDMDAEPDKELAIQWIENAARSGNKSAMEWLAKAYAKGAHTLPKDMGKSKGWSKMAESVVSTNNPEEKSNRSCMTLISSK